MARLVLIPVWLLLAALGAVPAAAQTPPPLSLQDAEARALQNHPLVKAGEAAAQAAQEASREARAAYFPTVVGSVTGVESDEGSRIAAGALNNPAILDRFAYGFAASQTVSDFGRTSNLTASARLRIDAQNEDVADRRARVLLNVDRAYFGVMRAQALASVARQTEAARQVVLEQVQTLASTGLKSTLDVSFAQVSLSEAQLLRLQAENAVQASYADLSNAMGERAVVAYDVRADNAAAVPLEPIDRLIARALADRADVARERLAQQSLVRLADAERALSFPVVSVAGAAGLIPYGEAGFTNHYAAIGINLSIPLFNGGLLSARHAEAQFRATASEQTLHDLENRVAHDVRVTWLEASNAYERLAVTSQLLAQATDARDLAQQRYTLGLSSIVELTQAQLNETRAQIEQVTARYDYEDRRALLRFQSGDLK